MNIFVVNAVNVKHLNLFRISTYNKIKNTMITFKKPKPGDIVTFYYSSKFPKVEAIYLELRTFNDGFGKYYQKPIIKLMQDISYTSTHHEGEIFKKDTEIYWFDPIFNTINGKVYIRNFSNLLGWIFYGELSFVPNINDE
jgi:hypothetical protein